MNSLSALWTAIANLLASLGNIANAVQAQADKINQLADSFNTPTIEHIVIEQKPAQTLHHRVESIQGPINANGSKKAKK